jgi:hypothetical protein
MSGLSTVSNCRVRLDRRNIFCLVRRRIGRPSVVGLVVYVVLVIGIIVGWVVPGGTGDSILAISAGLLALVIVASIGLGKAASDSVDRRGRWGGPPL